MTTLLMLLRVALQEGRSLLRALRELDDELIAQRRTN